ncbi:MAG: MOSC domain-containing protein [Sulfurovum sp.]|nr:MAG: MOSC domain-containing protein [Sulfurovum sp.]
MKKIGSVTKLIRYPIKSMQGEEINTSIITKKGLLGDRAYALIDTKTNKIVSAKNPKKWSNIFKYNSKFITEPSQKNMTDVQIIFPNNSIISSSEKNIDALLSSSFNRNVKLTSTVPREVQLEEYYADIQEMEQPNAVEDATMVNGTFFDLGTIHLLTSSTIAKLKELYPEGDFNINRFRPNIFIDLDVTTIEFIENDWVGKEIAIGNEVILKVKQPCPRCVMTTLEQKNIVKDTNILKTAIKNNNGNIGVYADVVRTGTINNNDIIQIIS